MSDAVTTPVEQEPMRRWWLSWYHLPSYGEFELHWPWWISGMRMSDDADTIVAAVKAPTEQEVWRIVHAAYDTSPTPGVEQRFCEEVGIAELMPWEHPDTRFAASQWMLRAWNR